jgi:gliding motility-associated lipoprotein GldH
MIFILPLIVLFVASCGGSGVTQYQNVSESKLGYTDTLDFEFVIRDTALTYDFETDISIETVFPYQNLYFKVYYELNQVLVDEGVFSHQFYDDMGMTLGRCLVGKCKNRYPVQKAVKFAEQGALNVRIVQHSRQDDIVGIRRIGVRMTSR